MIGLIIIIAMNWRDLGRGIGSTLVRSRKRGKRSRYSFAISFIVWGIAFGLLVNAHGTIFNPTTSTTTNSTLTKIVGASPSPPNPFLWGGFVPALSSLIQNTWFDTAFLGLLVVGGLVLVQGVRVAMKEEGEMGARELASRRIQGLEMVNNSLALIEDQIGDPRSRIIACYQNMITVVSRLGGPVHPDLTARELENEIRSTFAITGPATGELTQLFEEARYSLHDINDDDATKAHTCLESIAAELQLKLDSK